MILSDFCIINFKISKDTNLFISKGKYWMQVINVSIYNISVTSSASLKTLNINWWSLTNKSLFSTNVSFSTDANKSLNLYNI